MKFSAASVASALLLSTASAAPHPNAERRAALANRGEKRAFDLTEVSKRGQKQSHVNKNFFGYKLDAGGPGGYAGPTAFDTGINMVTATVVIPPIVVPPGAQDGVDYGIAAWVGVQSGGGLLQTGMIATVNTSSPPVYSLFWEFVGNLPVQSFQNPFSYTAGDTLTFEVLATGVSSGEVSVTKQSTGEVAKLQSAFSGNIGTKSANFVLEDYGVGSGSIPFAAWSGDWTWTGCSYGTSGSGIKQTLTTDSVGEIMINGNNITQTTINSDTGYTITYTGTSADTATE